MKKSLHLIYVPGLGQGDYRGQRLAVQGWHLWGVEAELFPINWGDRRPWQAKFKLLLKRIDELSSEGKAVSLVGASAGASAVINAFAARQDKVVGVVLVAGKINHPENIHSVHEQINPAFVTSVNDCQTALVKLGANGRRQILSRYGLIDKIVPRADSVIDNGNNQMALSIGHGVTIAAQITLGSASFIRFLKRQPRR